MWEGQAATHLTCRIGVLSLCVLLAGREARGLRCAGRQLAQGCLRLHQPPVRLPSSLTVGAHLDHASQRRGLFRLVRLPARPDHHLPLWQPLPPLHPAHSFASFLHPPLQPRHT